MPLYEYLCTKCNHRFEKIQNFSAAPLTDCPKCSGELIRPLTAPALQFKGAGWYVNDYSSKGSASASAAKAESAPAESPAGCGTAACGTGACAAAAPATTATSN